jgi:MFS family permease
MSSIAVATRARNGNAGASIALIALALLGGSSARTVLSPLQELMRADLSLTDNQVSLIQGAAMAFPLALVSVPIGRLVDRSSRTRLLVVLALLCAVGSAMTALAHGFGTMLLARALVGISVGGALPAAVSLGADLSAAAHRSKVMAVLGVGQVAGTAGAFLLAGSLLARLPASFDPGFGLAPLAPWRLLQLLFSLGMGVLALVLFLLREPPRQEAEQARGQGLRATLAELGRHRRVLVPLVVGMVSISMADAAANVWAVPVLTRSLHQQPADFGAWMGLLLMAGGFLGVIVGGLLGDAGQRIGGSTGLLGAAALVAVVAAPMACFPLMPTTTGFACLLGLLMLFGAAAGIIGTAAITVLIPNELRGLSFSLVGTLSIVLPFGIAPSLVSLVAQVTGDGSDIRMPLTVVGLATSAAGVAGYLMAMRATRSAA